MAETTVAQPSGLEAWQRSLPWWDAYFAVVAVGTIAVVDNWVAVLLLLAMSLWYVLFGRKAMWGGCAEWVGLVYLIGAGLLLVPAVALASGASFILFALSPQAHMALGFRWGTVATIILNLVPTAVSFAKYGEIRNTFPIGLLAIVLTTIIGYSIDRMLVQSKALARSRAEVERLSRDAERQRIAGDLHDTLAQGLSSVLMLVEAASTDVEGEAKRHLDLAARTARENLQEVRAVLDALMPAKQDLAEAVRRLAAGFTQDTGVAATVEVEGAPQALPVAIDVVLLRAVQESLSNVRRHADAAAVRLKLCYESGSVRLEVSDDGHGFLPMETMRGYGLQAMRNRVGQIGGAFDLGSADTGTTVRVTIPC